MHILIDHFDVHLCNVKACIHHCIKTFMLCFVVGVSAAAPVNGDVTGKVIAVIDGNTVQVSGSDNQTHKIFLVGIDSPELEQEFGDQAKRFLEKLLLGKSVTVQFKGKDRFGNSLAVVILNGRDPRIALLKEGLAWTSEKNPLEDLETYRTWAQRKGKGLWKQENPVPPWTYRRQQTMLRPKSS